MHKDAFATKAVGSIIDKHIFKIVEKINRNFGDAERISQRKNLRYAEALLVVLVDLAGQISNLFLY
jgi:hypothetical protein